MLVEAEIWSIARIGQENAVLIRPVGSEVAVPIYIDQYQTQSILIGLGNVTISRPLTHDLLISILTTLGVRIDRIEITSLKEGTFYAQIILERNGEKIAIDSRPSDSIALAVRKKCPIFIAENVVEQEATVIRDMTGETVENIERVQSARSVETGTTEGMSEKDDLERKLQKAIDEENYELAAVLRDKLQELDPGDS